LDGGGTVIVIPSISPLSTRHERGERKQVVHSLLRQEKAERSHNMTQAWLLYMLSYVVGRQPQEAFKINLLNETYSLFFFF